MAIEGLRLASSAYNPAAFPFASPTLGGFFAGSGRSHAALRCVALRRELAYTAALGRGWSRPVRYDRKSPTLRTKKADDAAGIAAPSARQALSVAPLLEPAD